MAEPNRYMVVITNTGTAPIPRIARTVAGVHRQDRDKKQSQITSILGRNPLPLAVATDLRGDVALKLGEQLESLGAEVDIHPQNGQASIGPLSI